MTLRASVRDWGIPVTHQKAQVWKDLVGHDGATLNLSLRSVQLFVKQAEIL